MAFALQHIAIARQHRLGQRMLRGAGGKFPAGHTTRSRIPRQLQPKLIEADYAHALVGLLDVTKKPIKRLIDELPKLLPAVQATRGDAIDRADAGELQRALGMIRDARTTLEGAMSRYEIERLARRYASQTTAFQKQQFARQVQAAIGVDLFTHDRKVPAMVDHFAAENVALIRSLGDRSLADVEKVVTRAFRSGARAEDVASDIEDRYGVHERHARLIARDQIGTLNGQVNAARQQELGLNEFTWRTAEDERVRPEHADLDGQVFSYDEPPSEGLPGEPVLCRCYAEPMFGKLLDAIDQ